MIRHRIKFSKFSGKLLRPINSLVDFGIFDNFSNKPKSTEINNVLEIDKIFNIMVYLSYRKFMGILYPT